MGPVVAVPEDAAAWLALSAEVEALFGEPMSTDPSFARFLLRNIERTTAFVVREDDGPPGTPLMGAVTWSPGRRQIGWLAVAPRWRGMGVGVSLVEYVLARAGPGPVAVVTFSADVTEGAAARRLYERLGFRCVGPAPGFAAGSSRDLFVRDVARTERRQLTAADDRSASGDPA